MIGVMIIPTGLGAKIGGDAGDASPAAKLLARCCDTLIVHPNVVNASDINEMTENMLYVEGSILDRFLAGQITLQKTNTYNRILTIANPSVTEETVNAVSAARVTVGAQIEILELSNPLRMVAKIEKHKAAGDIYGFESLRKDLNRYGLKNFDALAIHTPIEVDRNMALNYYRNGGINPWGGVEALLSKQVANFLDKPTAHAPLESVTEDDEELFLIFRERITPRIAPEAISNCYLHCVFKGLHRAPKLASSVASGQVLAARDIDFMVSPEGCWGPPHDCCMAASIPIIFVKENVVTAPLSVSYNYGISVDNYLEAAGHIMTMQAGVVPESVRANFSETILSTSKV